MKQKFCVLICVHARKIRSSKNAALAFALLSQTFKKSFFHGFGGLEATFRLKFYDLFLSITCYMLIDFRKTCFNNLINNKLQATTRIQLRLFEY